MIYISAAFWAQSLASLHLGAEYHAESYRGRVSPKAACFSGGKGKKAFTREQLDTVMVVSCDYHVIVSPQAQSVPRDCHVTLSHMPLSPTGFHEEVFDLQERNETRRPDGLRRPVLETQEAAKWRSGSWTSAALNCPMPSAVIINTSVFQQHYPFFGGRVLHLPP